MTSAYIMTLYNSGPQITSYDISCSTLSLVFRRLHPIIYENQ